MVDRRHLLAMGVGLGTAIFLPGNAVAAVPDPAHIQRQLAAVRAAFRTARYADLNGRLPRLRHDALAVQQVLTGSRGQSAAAVLAQVHILSSELAVKAVDSTAAWDHALDAASAARSSGDPVVLAEATRICATPLRRQGRADEAVRLLTDTIAQLHASTSGRVEPSITAAVGSLALTAYSAALVDEAADSAGRLTDASRTGAAGLTAHHVRLYQVGVHHLLGHDDAVQIAWRTHPRMLPPGERGARLATDTARALLALDDNDRTFAALLAVEDAAPEEAARPSVRALTGELLARRPRLAGLNAFAARTGAVPA